MFRIFLMSIVLISLLNACSKKANSLSEQEEEYGDYIEDGSDVYDSETGSVPTLDQALAEKNASASGINSTSPNSLLTNPNLDVNSIFGQQAKSGFDQMNTCLKKVLLLAPTQGATSETLSAVYEIGKQSLVNCYRKIVKHQARSVPWQPQVRNHFDNDLYLAALLTILKENKKLK